MAQWLPPKYAPVSDTSDIFVLDLSKMSQYLRWKKVVQSAFLPGTVVPRKI